jgi:hypothetical protein
MASLEITREEPVHFRVRATGPHPLPEYPFQLHLEIEYLNHPTAPRYLAITPSEFEEYAEAIEEAITNQAVYKVSWDYPETPDSPSDAKDTTIHRLLNALRDRRTVAAEAGGTDAAGRE